MDKSVRASLPVHTSDTTVFGNCAFDDVISNSQFKLGAPFYKEPLELRRQSESRPISMFLDLVDESSVFVDSSYLNIVANDRIVLNLIDVNIHTVVRFTFK